MGLLSRAGDTFYAFRFLRLLTTPWEKTRAYQMGIIDDKGTVIKKPETSEEKSVYNLFHRLVFNVKRLLNKVPFGKTTIASYLSALFLIKEHCALTDDELLEALSVELDTSFLIEENLSFSSDILQAGRYFLNSNIALPSTGEVLALRGTSVLISEDTSKVGDILGVPVFKALHEKTKQTIFVTSFDLI